MNPLKIGPVACCARSLPSKELLFIYSIKCDSDAIFPTQLDTVIDELLPYSTPWEFRNSTMYSNNCVINILESFSNSDTKQYDTSQYYFTSITPETLDWRLSYEEDSDTKFIMTNLLHS